MLQSQSQSSDGGSQRRRKGSAGAGRFAVRLPAQRGARSTNCWPTTASCVRIMRSCSARWKNSARRNCSGGRTPASGSSTNRASPTTSMATRAAWSVPGSSTRFRSSSRRTNGGRSKPGLIQRATLLNKILADCYGAQELIRSRWLSPALVFAQPDFLRPCHGIRVPERHVPAFLRRRSGAFAGRTLVGGFRPHADSHRRGLRAGEPPGHVAHPARAVPRQSCPSPRRIFPRRADLAGATRAAPRRTRRAS